MAPALKPAANQALGQPPPPLQLEQLLQIDLIDRDPHADAAEDGEHHHLAQEIRPVVILQRVEEIAVPDIDPHLDADLEQRQRDDGAGQQTRLPAFLGIGEKGSGEAPKAPKKAGTDGSG